MRHPVVRSTCVSRLLRLAPASAASADRSRRILRSVVRAFVAPSHARFRGTRVSSSRIHGSHVLRCVDPRRKNARFLRKTNPKTKANRWGHSAFSLTFRNLPRTGTLANPFGTIAGVRSTQPDSIEVPLSNPRFESSKKPQKSSKIRTIPVQLVRGRFARILAFCGKTNPKIEANRWGDSTLS